MNVNDAKHIDTLNGGVTSVSVEALVTKQKIDI